MRVLAAAEMRPHPVSRGTGRGCQDAVFKFIGIGSTSVPQRFPPRVVKPLRQSLKWRRPIRVVPPVPSPADGFARATAGEGTGGTVSPNPPVGCHRSAYSQTCVLTGIPRSTGLGVPRPVAP